jgi:hypothetical protein
MGDAIEQDVQALKEWLRSAWHRLAQPSMTRFDRQELRNYMKEAEIALRKGVGKLVAEERVKLEIYNTGSSTLTGPDLRILRGLVLSSQVDESPPAEPAACPN